MKKLIKSIALLFILMNLALTVQMTVVHAAAPAPTEKCADSRESAECMIREIGKGTSLPSFETGQHPDAPVNYEAPGVGEATSALYYALDLFRYAISGIAILVIVVAATKLIGSNADDEVDKAKNTLVYGVIGLLTVNLAEVIVKKMVFGDSGEAFEDSVNAELFAEESVLQLRGIIGFIEIFVAAIAVLVIVIRGMALMLSAGDEEALTKAKTHIGYAAVGVVLVGISEIVVRGFIFPENGEKMTDVEAGKNILAMMTNYISGFVSIACFLALFYSGYLYVTSAGNEEVTAKVKKIVAGAAAGLLLAVSAFALSNTLVKFEEPTYSSEESLQDMQ